MLRLTFMLRRKPSMSREDMQRYWLEEHAALVAGHSRTLGMLRYVQVHTTDDEHEKLPGRRGKMEEPYDGVVEVWWESKAAMIEAVSSDDGRLVDRLLREDEEKFIDLKHSVAWFNYEYPQVNPTPENVVATERSSLLKLYFPLRQLDALTMEEAQWYWRTHHGPVIRRQAHGSGILRYQQVHRDEDQLTKALNVSRGCEVEPYLGHAEVWMDRSSMGNPTPENKLASRRAYEDEANFIDFARSTMFLAKEHVIIDRR
ncbi:MAG TPA: hypothetical protein DEB44_05895 [Acidimicrobiaceae bacterium]|nr:hypothetical protein [Acidimicrobiaceae bacterium]